MLRKSLILVFAGLAGLTAPGAQTQALAQGITKSVERYQDCLEGAKSGSLKAVEAAEKWFNETADPGALHCKGVALAARQDYAEAGAALLRASQSVGDFEKRAELLSQAGNAFSLAGDQAKALASIEQALKLAPGVPHLTPDLLTDRARIRVATDNCAGAIEDASAVLEQLPQHKEAALIRAGCSRLLDDFATARIDVERVLAIDPLDPDALLERALIAKEEEDYQSAKIDWQSVVDIAPDSAAAAQARLELAKIDARDQLRAE